MSDNTIVKCVWITLHWSCRWREVYDTSKSRDLILIGRKNRYVRMVNNIENDTWLLTMNGQ